VSRALACAALLSLVCPSVAGAQFYVGRDAPHAGSFELSGGAVWSRGFEQGSVSAEETRNSTTDTGPFVLFTAKPRMESATGGQARFGVYLAPALSVEGGVQYARPRITTRLDDDAESAEAVTAAETLTRLIADASVLFHLTGISFGDGRGVPFVRAGAGYLRELHEKNEVIETGSEYHVGGGLKVWFGRGRRRTGVRVDGGLLFRTGGADTPDTKRTVPTAGISLMYLF
jgi:hypothetical protein